MTVAPVQTFGERLAQQREPLRVVPADPDDNMTTSDIQALSEGVELDDTNSVELKGRRFLLAESIGLMPLMKFAHIAKSGLTSDDMEGLSAMYTLLRCCIDRTHVQAVDPETGEPQVDPEGSPVWEGPSQWELFEDHATETSADGEDLTTVIQQAVQAISARPTVRRGDSSPSSPPTSPSSKESSSSPVTPRVPPGFEDLTPVSALGQAGR